MKLHFAALLASAAILSSGRSQAEPPRPADVEVATAVDARLGSTRWVPGTVVSRDDARVASVVPGRVVDVAEVGTRLRKGQRLAKLEDTALRLRLEQVRADIARARAQRDLAATQRTRFERLAGGVAAVAPAQIDEVRAASATAEQDVARAEAQRRAIEHELAETEIRAPFDGVVSARLVQRGEYVGIGTAVAHLVDTDRVEARALAPLSLAARLQPGAAIPVRMDGDTRTAAVRTLVPVGDERSRQFELRVTLPDGLAPVGSALEVAVPEATAANGVAVPRDAIVRRGAQPYVVRVRSDDTAERVAVTPGVADGALVEIARGMLAIGDRVVVRGAELLADGQRVHVGGSG
ncbi:efflux RND transporter periplasmic adaptor subunit [Dokdonella sp.]|uniref:efflux RND transporter periplasmic adaptor subunit n=1 Tax=Dokdonella sp. TaxID=2291710 RepID=UPI002626E23E|nr:efflux RND transporter periplasmic adaptor subunit [Dokdonella sp.]